jgi:hypothetical protein
MAAVWASSSISSSICVGDQVSGDHMAFGVAAGSVRDEEPTRAKLGATVGKQTKQYNAFSLVASPRTTA